MVREGGKELSLNRAERRRGSALSFALGRARGLEESLLGGLKVDIGAS